MERLEVEVEVEVQPSPPQAPTSLIFRLRRPQGDGG